MDLQHNQIQYITSHEGLRAAMLDIFKEIKSNDFRTSEVKPPASRKEACKFLSISEPTLDLLLKNGQIPSFRIGRHVRINWIDLEAYIGNKSH